MSARSVVKSDYVGFTYGTKHSSELGIVRVSNGSRFNENLLPTIQDKTVQIPGGDGTYYFGSYYTQRQFSISFAFDDLTEAEIATLKAHFGDKGIHDLIFDEAPYKIWRAKVTGTATIKHLVFDEGENKKRVYKGEGTIQFTCYYPFARCAFSDTVTKESLCGAYPNIDEWWDAARIEPGKNFGDIPVPFEMIISGSETNQNQTIYDIEWKNLPTTYAIKNASGQLINCEARGVLNTRTGIVVQEYKDPNNTDKWVSTGNILNKYVTGNLTAKIPVGETNLPDNISFVCCYI